MTLSVDLGHVHSNPAVHIPGHPRNGPARVRRRERCADARRLDAGEAGVAGEAGEAGEAAQVVGEAEVIDDQEKPSSEYGEATADVEKVDEVNSGAAEKVVTAIVSDVYRQ